MRRVVTPDLKGAQKSVSAKRGKLTRHCADVMLGTGTPVPGFDYAMARELIGGYAAADYREQMGRFLRHAFPLGVGSFVEELKRLEQEERARVPPNQ